jgi:hypothetical protein
MLEMSLFPTHRRSLTVNVEPPATPKPTPRSNQDDAMKQDIKDVERDAFIVNGCYVKGASGYEAVLATVADALLDEDASLGPETAHDMAIQIIRLANRTQSGGDSYEAVVRLLGCPALVVIVADSELAPPITITIGVGNHGGYWGCGATVSAATVYRILDADAPVRSSVLLLLRDVSLPSFGFCVCGVSQDDSDAVWARVEACHVQSVYVGAKPSDDVTTAPSTLYVLRRHVASAKSAYPYSASYATTIPAAAAVTFTLIDNANLASYKAKVADAVVAAKRKAKMIQQGLPESNEDDDGAGSISTRSVSSLASSVVLKTEAHEVKAGAENGSVILRQPGPSVAEIIASNDTEQAPLPFYTQV